MNSIGKTQRLIIHALVVTLSQPNTKHGFMTSKNSKRVSKLFIDTVYELGIERFIKRNTEDRIEFFNGSTIIYVKPKDDEKA